jgi:hypothetical protein
MKKHVEQLQIYIYLFVPNISERNLNRSINPECGREDTSIHPKTLAGSLYAQQAHAVVLCQRFQIEAQAHAMVSMRCSAKFCDVLQVCSLANPLHRYLVAKKRKGNRNNNQCQTKRKKNTLSYERCTRATNAVRKVAGFGKRITLEQVAHRLERQNQPRPWSLVEATPNRALRFVRRWAFPLRFRPSIHSFSSRDFFGVATHAFILHYGFLSLCTCADKVHLAMTNVT